jgi:hypothetical protein
MFREKELGPSPFVRSPSTNFIFIKIAGGAYSPSPGGVWRSAEWGAPPYSDPSPPEIAAHSATWGASGVLERSAPLSALRARSWKQKKPRNVLDIPGLILSGI